MRIILALILSLAAAGAAMAVQPDEMLDDPVLEARAREISKDLRCLVCRNENIDSSNAKLARDLRLLVRERLVAGDTDEETMQYMVDRYGEFVLLRPSMSMGNLVLWFSGPLLLVVGGVGVFFFMRRQRPAPQAAAGLSAEEAARLRELTES